MRIEYKGGSLDLRQGFTLDIEETSPIFNDEGSQSVSATVPATHANRRLLGYPGRLDTAADPNASDGGKATITDGVFRRTGTMNVTGSSCSEGISFSIGFDNSTAYQAWTGRKLRDLSGLPKIFTTVEALIDRLSASYRECDPLDDFAVFPVALSKSVKDEESVSAKTYWEMINVPASDGSMTQPGKLWRLVDNTPTEVTVPGGYGLSPFLRVWKVLELVFTDLGVTVAENPFRDRTDLARLVVLNNSADTICAGTLDYSELMPDSTVEEFLEGLWVRFGLVYHVDSERGTATLRLLDDILGMLPQEMEADRLRSSARIDISWLSPQYVRLSASASIDGTAPACERFEDYVKGVSLLDLHVGPDVGRSMAAPSTRASSYSPTGQNTWLGRGTVTGRWWKLDRVNGLKKDSSSGFFNWDPAPDGIEALDLTSTDVWVTVEKISIGSTGTANPFNGYAPAFLVSSRHFHTYVKGNDNEEETETTPLAFMWAYPVDGVTVGRLAPEAPDGKELEPTDGGAPGTTLYFQFADGLFNRYWKRYDEVLRHGPRSIEVDIRIKKRLLQSVDILRPLVLGGCLCLIDKLEYSLPSGPEIEARVTLRAIQPVGAYDIEAEQGVPAVAMTGVGLGWVFYEGDWQAAEDAKRPQLDEQAYLKFRENLGHLETYGDGNGIIEDIIIDPMGITATSDWVEEMPRTLSADIPTAPAGTTKLVTFRGRVYYSCRMVKRVYDYESGSLISKEPTGEIAGYCFVDYTFDAVYVSAYVVKR